MGLVVNNNTANDRPRQLSQIVYKAYKIRKSKTKTKPLTVLGIDTEAYANGKCFMISFSDGAVFRPDEFPACLFSRKYRNGNFVAYNLKYDEGALIQRLPKENILELREKGKTKYDDYRWESIPGKMLKIARGKNAVHMFDMMSFYGGSLDYNAQKYLGQKKIAIATKTFTKPYVTKHWRKLAKYCVKDAELVQQLAEVLINKFADFGVTPKRLFSTAYVSYQYFSQKTNYVTVQKIYDNHKPLLDLALRSYNGGKFEITEKGTSYMYEYDLISAYPYEIANLIDIRYCDVVYSKRYRKGAYYGFIDCTIEIPTDCANPSPVMFGQVSIYPVGTIRRVITLSEYDYFVERGAYIKIHKAAWLIPRQIRYPYRKEINNLIKHKQQFAADKDDLGYHTIKIFMNSIYGKMAQAIKKGDKWHTSTCWNPLYASIITANCRVRISEYQEQYPSVIAVHTDSLISKEPLPFPKDGSLGDMVYKLEGDGLLLGCGIYQIGDKFKFRGVRGKGDLFDLVDRKTDSMVLYPKRPLSWKEVAAKGWNINRINRFEKVKKTIKVDFDCKRVWIDDYTKFYQLLKRNVLSIPHIALGG